jgi:hypothetical protein
MSSTPFAEPIGTPLDAATAAVPIPQDAEPHRWPLAMRIGFRLAFCYLAVWCLCNGNATIFDCIPVWGDYLQGWAADPFLYAAQWLAQHLFHVPPPGNAIHPTGSGDTAINWIASLLLLVLSIVAAAIWSMLDRRRPHYQTLSAWLRFLVRLTLGFGMVTYGLAKVFPMQMPQPSIMSLAEPLGMHSPMALLWTFIGTNTVYEIICGSAELLAGLLLLFRRTALFGAMVTAFVVTNVLLYNLCFDVPVKLYAAHLLLLSLVLILPDMRQLFRFFWLHQPAAPAGVWVPPATRPWFRRTTIAIEIVFAALTLIGTGYQMFGYWHPAHQARLAPNPLRGAWRIDSAYLVDATGNHIPHPLLSTQKLPLTELDIDSPTRAAMHDAPGAWTYYQTKTDLAKHTIEFTGPDKFTATYNFGATGKEELTLTPIESQAKTFPTLALTLVSPPGGYPLMTRGFHWVSEYPYQR